MSEPLRVVASRYCLEFNRCSPPNGQCVQQGRVEFCRCRGGFQGPDCSESSISSTISTPPVTPGSIVRHIKAHYKHSRPTSPPLISSQYSGSRIHHTIREYTIPVANDTLAMQETSHLLVQQRLPPPPYFHAVSTLPPPIQPESEAGGKVIVIGGVLFLFFIVGGAIVVVWRLMQKLFVSSTVPPGPHAVLSRRPAKKEKEEKEDTSEEKEEQKEEEELEKHSLVADPIEASKAQWNV